VATRQGGESQDAEEPLSQRTAFGIAWPLRGRWLLFARVTWVLAALTVLGLDAAGLPHAYARLDTVCHSSACTGSDEVLSPADVSDLRELGISLDFYAGFTVGLSILGTVVFAVTAAAIFFRRSDDKMALLTSFTLLIFGGATFNGTMQYLVGDYPLLWWPINLLEYVGQMAFNVFFLTFPDGRFVPRWTRWLAVLWAVLFVPDVFLSGSSLNLLDSPLFIVYVATLVFAQVYRYSKVSNPAERQQTKWVVFGFAAAILGFVATVVLGSIVPGVREHEAFANIISGVLIYAFIVLIPLSISVAVLRSRLYDIDVVINRTLVYTILTTVLGLLYFGSIALMQAILLALTGQGAQLAVVASTLLIAALFNPIRHRTRSLVDRRFYRGKYDAEQVLAAFSGRLRDETDLDMLSEDLLVVVRETVQPEHVSLWLKPWADRERRGR
jgi:hypothetical protein